MSWRQSLQDTLNTLIASPSLSLRFFDTASKPNTSIESNAKICTCSTYLVNKISAIPRIEQKCSVQFSLSVRFGLLDCWLGTSLSRRGTVTVNYIQWDRISVQLAYFDLKFWCQRNWNTVPKQRIFWNWFFYNFAQPAKYAANIHQPCNEFNSTSFTKFE